MSKSISKNKRIDLEFTDEDVFNTIILFTDGRDAEWKELAKQLYKELPLKQVLKELKLPITYYGITKLFKEWGIEISMQNSLINYWAKDENKKRMSDIKKQFFKEHPEAIDNLIKIQKKFWSNSKNRKKQSNITKKYYSNPENRKKTSDALKIVWENNPKLSEKVSIAIKNAYNKNPELREKMSNIANKLYQEHPEIKQKIAKSVRQFHKDNPDYGQNHSLFMLKYYSNPKNRQKQSERIKQSFIDNPSLIKNHKKYMKKYYSNPENRKKISILTKTAMNKPEIKKKMKIFYESQKKTYVIISPDGISYNIHTQKKVFEFLKNNKISFNLYKYLNKGKVFFVKSKFSNKKTLQLDGWEIKTIKKEEN